MKKKAYQKPAMQVINIQHSQMLCSSPGAQSLSLPGGEDINWQDDGFADDVDDY